MDLKNKVRHVPDFPKAGIDFIDITPLLHDPVIFEYIIDRFAKELENIDFEYIACTEARGFIFGAPLAYKLKKGFIPIRKKGKLPAETISVKYDLEYGFDILEIHDDAVKPGEKVVIIDDLLATGGTIQASINLFEKLGGEVVKILFLIELEDLKAIDKFKNYDVFVMERL